MVLGDLDTSDLGAAGLAADSGCTILSVEYRLAPEVRFPGQVDDATAALAWLHDHAHDLGVDPGRIGVYGVSAGGALAASLTLRSRDGAAPPLAAQALLYPMLDNRSAGRPTTRDAVAGTFSREAKARAWDDYLGPDVDRDAPPRYAVPARSESLDGLPPTYLEVGGIDVLVEEVVRYAGRLVTSDVNTELHVYPGAYHGFDVIAAKSNLARTALARRMNAMQSI
jgi:triacylglycerol lipase